MRKQNTRAVESEQNSQNKKYGDIFSRKKKRSFVSRFEQKHQQSMSAEKIFKNLFIKTTKL